ncbi:MAG: hypothetical protein R3C56_36920 [Pirellulaceae bacterium]|jgi:hypothetical protein
MHNTVEIKNRRIEQFRQLLAKMHDRAHNEDVRQRVTLPQILSNGKCLLATLWSDSEQLRLLLNPIE